MSLNMDGIFDLMCACAARRLKGHGWSHDEAQAVTRVLADSLRAAIPRIVDEELPEAAVGMEENGILTEENLTIALTSLAAIGAVEVVDKLNRRRVAERN